MKPLSSSEFLQLVWPKKLLTHETMELRVIRRDDGKIHREFATSIPDFLERASQHKDKEVYFGVATRFGHAGQKVDCYRVSALWCDLDKRKLDECHFSIKPQVLVESGGGVHAYWLLENPVLVRGERWEPIERRTRWLAKQFQGDPNTTDIARILRVPSFLNHKYDPVRKVKAYLV